MTCHANCPLKFEKICMKCQRGCGSGVGGGGGGVRKIRKKSSIFVFSQYQVTPEFGKGKFFFSVSSNSIKIQDIYYEFSAHIGAYTDASKGTNK